MRINDPDLLMSEVELACIAAKFGVSKNELNLLPNAPDDPTVAQAAFEEYRHLPGAHQKQLAELLPVFAAPRQVGILHYSVSDERMSRQFLAWDSPSNEAIAFLARTPSAWRVGKRSSFEIQTLLAQVLAVDEKVTPDPLSVALTTLGVLTWLSILDQLNYVRLYSRLTHTAPVNSFAVSEVHTRLKEARVEDFRWFLPFIDKILPVDIPLALEESDLINGFQELSQVGLIEPLSDEQQPLLYTLTDEGELVADIALHEVSKAGLRLSTFLPDGQIGHEVMLFIRSPFYLLLLDMAGEAAAMATLTRDGFSALLEQTLAPLAAVPSPTASVISSCPNCGSPVSPTARFCGQCGKSLRI